MMDRNRPAAAENSRLIDVRHALLASSSRVQVAQLAKQGKKTISLLSKERMAELINQAVRQLVNRFRDAAAGATPVIAPSNDKSAVEKLQELIQDYEETSKAKADLEVSRQVLHDELEEIRKHIALEKARAEGLIEEDLENVQFLGTADFDRQINSIISDVFESRKTAYASSQTPEALKELQELQSPIHDLVFRLVKEQRARFRVRSGANSREISMLEKRIEKLYSQLGDLENALKLISSSKLQSNQAVLNALRQLGLLNEDKYFEKKREMLKIVLDTNKDIRKGAKDLEAQGITLSSARRQAAS
jgi:hypothetical protein